MEDFPFRPYHDAPTHSNPYIPTPMNISDHLEPVRNALKIENLTSPLQGPQPFSRNRFNSFELLPLFPLPREDDQFQAMHDHLRQEALMQDFVGFPQAGLHVDHGFDPNFGTRIQDYNVDYYRINRSRGPSFNLGPGRKGSEDLFAHGFDNLLSSYFGNHDLSGKKAYPHDNLDTRMQTGFLDEYKTAAQLLPNVMPGNFASMVENNYIYGINPDVQNHQNLGFSLQQIQTLHDMQNMANQSAQAHQPGQANEEGDFADYDTKGKKKRRLHNGEAQEAPVASQDKDSLASLQMKKSKSEIKKPNDSPLLNNQKATISKPAAKKPTDIKSLKTKRTVSTKSEADAFNVKSEHNDKEEKSTEAGSTTNVSPNFKKDDNGIFKNKPGLAEAFSMIKKPETAQELMSGLNLPAEVQEYLNNSKIFNQIKAPSVKKIGTLTMEERRVKIEKYLEKRKRRSWNKRVNYDCRKKVADNRLRIKGRFVTKDQAFTMLEQYGIAFDPEKITNTEIKDLLTERFGALVPRKRATGTGKTDPETGKVIEDGEGDLSDLGSQDDDMDEMDIKE